MPMFDHSGRYAYKPENAIERYITVAIINAREVYTDPEWVFWADNWLSGRDRSYESTDRVHRRVRAENDRGKALLGDRSGWDREEYDSAAAASDMAVWAAGLALVTAPLAPDLTGTFLRFGAALRARLSDSRAARQSWHPRALARSAGAYFRRLAAPFSPSRIPTTGHAHPSA